MCIRVQYISHLGNSVVMRNLRHTKKGRSKCALENKNGPKQALEQEHTTLTALLVKSWQFYLFLHFLPRKAATVNLSRLTNV